MGKRESNEPPEDVKRPPAPPAPPPPATGLSALIQTNCGKLEFEGGNLVKVDGARPDYMDGYQLIRLVKGLAKYAWRSIQAEVELERLKEGGSEERIKMLEHQLVEVCGCVEEYVDMPCSSLRSRMKSSAAIAQKKMTECQHDGS